MGFSSHPENIHLYTFLNAAADESTDAIGCKPFRTKAKSVFSWENIVAPSESRI